MKYPDSVILVDPVVDNYGTEKIGRMETVAASVGQVQGYSQSSHQADITSDAIAYLDPTNSFVVEKFNRLEGMMLIMSEGEAQADSWYRIVSASVGKKSLTTNALDNVQVNLNKSVSLPSVS
jgi:hypothetical protein